MKKNKETRGGYRENAKRPLKYGEPTVRLHISVPETKEKFFKDLLETELKKLEVKKA